MTANMYRVGGKFGATGVLWLVVKQLKGGLQLPKYTLISCAEPFAFFGSMPLTACFCGVAKTFRLIWFVCLDYVYFETSSTSPYQIRRIEELNKTASGNVEAKVMCFYRRRDLPSPLIQLADKHQCKCTFYFAVRLPTRFFARYLVEERATLIVRFLDVNRGAHVCFVYLSLWKCQRQRKLFLQKTLSFASLQTNFL